MMNLTPAERLILLNQFRILEKLDPASTVEFARARLTLERGYAAHYGELDKLVAPAFDEVASREVLEILNMFRLLKKAVPRNAKANPETEHLPVALSFRGFDAATEQPQIDYLTYLIDHLGRFVGFRADSYDAGVPMMPTYRALYAAWRRCSNRNAPTLDDCLNIARAAA